MHPHPGVGGVGGGGDRVFAVEVEPHRIVRIKVQLDSPPRAQTIPHTETYLQNTIPPPLQIQANGEALAVDAVHVLRDDGLVVAPAVGVPVEARPPVVLPQLFTLIGEER